MTEHYYIQIPKTARVSLLTNDTSTNQHLLICLHGYGQMSTYFSRRFESLTDTMDVLIPEGMNRFYLQGTSGRVGASWMTKEERETDISDNMNYLDQLIAQYGEKYKTISLLGFSQGGATAARYFYQSNKVDQLVLWATVIPPDLKIELVKADKRPVHFALGTEDEYFTKENQKDIIALYKNLGFDIYVFEGSHQIDETTLTKVACNLIENALA
jgi:predicted esterase